MAISVALSSDVEFSRRLVEVGARRHFDAEGVVQKRHGIEIGFQDFFFGVGVLDLDRGDRFFYFSRERALAADFLRVQIARELLGESRTALRIADQRAQKARHDAQQINAEVVIKAMVFGGDQGVDDMRERFDLTAPTRGSSA